MSKVVSVIPPQKDDQASTSVLGTKVLLDNGDYLQGVTRVTLVADPANHLWKAIIEVHPINQQQVDALLSELIVVGDKDEPPMP